MTIEFQQIQIDYVAIRVQAIDTEMKQVSSSEEAAAGISLGPRKEFKSEISHSYWRANTATGCVM